MLSDRLIYLIVLHMIEQMTERLHDMTSNRMLLDVRVSPKKTRYDYNLTIMKSPKPATDNRFKK
jgi:hypothetical protein